MSGKILVTDSLFIFDEHVKQLQEAGFEIERLDKPDATEEEICEAVKGKVGYILGGIEKVTDRVIDAADELKAIVFTGADYNFFVPGWHHAAEKGIAVANAPGSNRYAVSEFAVGVALALQRNLFELGRTGSKTFEVSGTLKDATIGIVGMGRIGARIAELARAFEPANVLYYSRTEKQAPAKYVPFDTLASQSDLIFVAIPSDAGKLFNAEILHKLKPGALVVSISATDVFDLDVLLQRLQAGTVRAAIDHPAPSEAFTKLPLSIWFNTNAHTAYNTTEANKVASDRATLSMINLLTTGTDQNKVN